eukprot:4826742-Alexandrium_andersonii.AAC.1
MPVDVIALFLLTIESDKSRFESCWVIGEETVAARGQGPTDFPPGPPLFVKVADKSGGEVSISPLVMRVTQGHSVPWIMLGRLGRPLDTPTARASLGGFIYHLT